MNLNMTGLKNKVLSLAILSVPLSLLIISACGGGSSGSGSGSGSLINGPQAASVVVGQINYASSVAATTAFNLNSPFSNVYVSGSNLYISDFTNNRVLVFNSIPTTNGASASYALGEPDLITSEGGSLSATATTLSGPQSPVISGGQLFVSDFGNNRIAIYNTVPTASPGTIDVVAGQADTVSKASACSAAGLFSPESVSVAGGKMVVADGNNNRVLIWNSIPTASGTNADLVLGQTTLASCTANAGGTATASTINYAGGAWTDGSRLVVIDKQNNRVLIWNNFPTTSGQSADLVLGQPDFVTTTPGTTATTLNGPYDGVFVDTNGRLFVTDTLNNRVLVWNSFPTKNGQAADQVLGQPDFVTNTAGTSATTLNGPVGVYVSGTQVFVTDGRNNRVLIY